MHFVGQVQKFVMAWIRCVAFFPKASLMLGFSFSLLNRMAERRSCPPCCLGSTMLLAEFGGPCGESFVFLIGFSFAGGLLQGGEHRILLPGAESMREVTTECCRVRKAAGDDSPNIGHMTKALDT